MSHHPTTSGWHVYIVYCRDGTYYTGIAKDPARRLGEHNSANGGAKYTRSRRPVTLVYVEPAASRSAAAKREYQLKKLPLEKKKLLIGALSAVRSEE
jgi:putative endonuclease